MPLYEYVCESCEHAFEVLQSLGADAEGIVCPGCGHPRVHRQLSTFAAATGGGGAAAVAAPADGCCRGTPT